MMVDWVWFVLGIAWMFSGSMGIAGRREFLQGNGLLVFSAGVMFICASFGVEVFG